MVLIINWNNMVTVKELTNGLEVIRKEFKNLYYNYIGNINGDYLLMSNYKEWEESDVCISVLDYFDGSYKNAYIKKIMANGDIVVKDEINRQHGISLENVPIEEWPYILNRMDHEFLKPKTSLNTKDITDWDKNQIELFQDCGIDYEEGVDLFDITETKQYISRSINIAQYGLPSGVCIDWNETYERYLNDFIKVEYKGTNYYIID